METNVKLILKYLKQKNCVESFITLERETQINLVNYTKQIQFFKKIILKGDFHQAIHFLSTFQGRIQEKDFKKIILDIYRQYLCELIQNPQEEELKNLFEKQLINYCTEEEYQQLFNFLTFRTVNQIDGYQKWTVIKGRYQCFEHIFPYLEMFNSVVKPDFIDDKLEDIIENHYKNKHQVNNFKPIDYMKQTFQKNKSAVIPKIPQILINNPSSLNSIEEEDEDRRKKTQNSERQKQVIKNSIISMNIVSNYSQMKNKSIINNASNNFQSNKSKKYNYSEEVSQSRYDKNQSNLDKKNFQKDKNNSMEKQQIQERRPRVNASINGSGLRQSRQEKKMQGSIKVDNFMKNQSKSYQNESANSFKNIKIDKSQLINNSNTYQPYNISTVSNKSYSNRIEGQILSHLHDHLQSSQLNEIQQQDHSQTVKSVKNDRPPILKYSVIDDDQLDQDIKKNIEYLEQTSSVIYKNKEEFDKQHFSFNENDKEQFEAKKITKLAAVSDIKAIRTCQFSDSGNFFAVGTNSSILKIFDVQKLFIRNKYQQIHPIYEIGGLHLKSIFCLDWSKNERSIITCSNDLNIKITQINKDFSQHKSTVIGKHESCVRMIKFNNSQSKIFSCGDDSCVKIWDLGKAKKCTTLKSHTNSVSALKLHDQNQVYTVSKDMTIKKWDIRINENVATSKVQQSELTYIADHIPKIVVSHKNGTISFFNRSLQLEHSVQIHDEEIRSINGLKNSNTLLTASFDGHVALFNQSSTTTPTYYQHNDLADDKVVFATFLNSSHYKGFASTSTQGLCHVYSYE